MEAFFKKIIVFFSAVISTLFFVLLSIIIHIFKITIKIIYWPIKLIRSVSRRR